MSNIVISGYYGFGNAGDEAMLAAMIEALSDLDPHLNIIVLSGNPEDTRRRLPPQLPGNHRRVEKKRSSHQWRRQFAAGCDK